MGSMVLPWDPMGLLKKPWVGLWLTMGSYGFATRNHGLDYGLLWEPMGLLQETMGCQLAIDWAVAYYGILW
jgi:hypothetical protein